MTALLTGLASLLVFVPPFNIPALPDLKQSANTSKVTLGRAS